MNEIVVKSTGPLVPVVSIEDAINRHETFKTFVKAVMVPNRDYGVMPGTERKQTADGLPIRKNNTLLKPGAERHCVLPGPVDDYEDAGRNVDYVRGIFHYAGGAADPAPAAATPEKNRKGKENRQTKTEK